jgi:hypothetical protein
MSTPSPDPDEEVFEAKEGTYAMSVVVGLVLGAALFVIAFADNVTTGARILVSAAGIVTAAAFVLGPMRRVRVGHARFTIEYPMHRRVIPYVEVTHVEIQLRDERKENPIPMLVVKRRHASDVRLLGFADDVITVHTALNRRWVQWGAAHGHPAGAIEIRP